MGRYNITITIDNDTYAVLPHYETHDYDCLDVATADFLYAVRKLERKLGFVKYYESRDVYFGDNYKVELKDSSENKAVVTFRTAK